MKSINVARFISAFYVCAFLGVYAFQTASSSHAAPINYGDFEGTDVWYRSVNDETLTSGDPDSLFGAPTIGGNSLDFNPTSFFAEATPASNLDSTDAKLNFMVEAKPGRALSGLSFVEAGDTSLQRALGSSSDAQTEVSTNVFIDILEIQRFPTGRESININAQGSMSFTPSAGDYGLIADGAGADDFDTIWNGSFFIDFGPILLANGLNTSEVQVTKVTITFDNHLEARSASDSSALIVKKDADGGLIVVPEIVPEPTSAGLLLAGVAAALAARRRW